MPVLEYWPREFPPYLQVQHGTCVYGNDRQTYVNAVASKSYRAQLGTVLVTYVFHNPFPPFKGSDELNR